MKTICSFMDTALGAMTLVKDGKTHHLCQLDKESGKYKKLRIATDGDLAQIYLSANNWKKPLDI